MASSTQKGDSFEKSVYDVFKLLLENDEFYVPGKRSKIFRKKKYYSEARKSDIKFDVTIETYLNNSDKYSLLTIIECKNLNRPVSVDDVEEFDSKISQIGEHNTKGILVTCNSFQQTAFTLAVSKGLALARVIGDNNFEWISYRLQRTSLASDKIELYKKFIQPELPSEKFIGILNDRSSITISDFLLDNTLIDFYNPKEKFISIPFVAELRIDQIVEKLSTYGIFDGVRLNTEKLHEFLSSKYPVTFEFDEQLPNKVLGKIEFDPLKISITRCLRNDINRWRFTLAHEVGHLILHYNLLKDKMQEKSDNDFTLSFKYHVSDMTSKRLELQANIFASHLLLPVMPLEKYVHKYFTEQMINKGHLYLDNQPVNKQLVFSFLNNLSNDFEVSVEVAKIRLVALGLLKDHADQLSVRSILKNMGFK